MKLIAFIAALIISDLAFGQLTEPKTTVAINIGNVIRPIQVLPQLSPGVPPAVVNAKNLVNVQIKWNFK